MGRSQARTNAGSRSDRSARIRCCLSFTLGESGIKKKSSALSRLAPRLQVRGRGKKANQEKKRDTAAIAANREEDIDLSDMPEVVDWSGAEMGKFTARRKAR